MTKVFIVAAEASGDLLAAEIIDEIRKNAPDTVIRGIGKEDMAARGVRSEIDVSELSVIGLIEGLKVYKKVVALADQAADEILSFAPDILVLVDSWGFTLRVAQRIKARAPYTKIVKVVGPQVWATRAGRAKTLAGVVDHLVCIHAMEVPYYEPFGLPVTVMGNPALSRGYEGFRKRGREALQIAPDADVLLVLPGSRPSEIKNVAPELVEAAREVKKRRPETEIVIHPAASVRREFEASFPNVGTWSKVSPGSIDRFDVMASADYALACSGTVTSELAMQSIPFLVGYKTGWVTWALARGFLFKPKHVTLLNVAADDTEIAPEFVQTTFDAKLMADIAEQMLDDPKARAAQVEAQNKALSRMGEGDKNSAEIAADAILSLA
ncbi:lipid-A-disaccharide synthase [Henriciella sp. AS95]|uniref:lipid-A-disaccharide synthase n=1 Tax=Henriciella sp. AS95 TaxID=3135782 RepID=UPI0031717E71